MAARADQRIGPAVAEQRVIAKPAINQFSASAAADQFGVGITDGDGEGLVKDAARIVSGAH